MPIIPVALFEARSLRSMRAPVRSFGVDTLFRLQKSRPPMTLVTHFMARLVCQCGQACRWTMIYCLWRRVMIIRARDLGRVTRSLH